jgi:DNA-binding NarL/FixJ family response regulator
MYTAHASAVTSVLLLQDDPLMTLGLQSALKQQPGLEVMLEDEWDGHGKPVDVVVASYNRALQFVDKGSATRPDTALRRARVVVVTHRAQEKDVRVAMEKGVSGYLLQDCDIVELNQCVRHAAIGSRYFTGRAARTLAEGMLYPPLTARESEVLAELGKGKCNKAIAAALGVSAGTVKIHLKALYSKLHASSRTDAVRIATNRGLL